MSKQNIHSNATMSSLQNQTVQASSLDALRESLIQALGPFPLLFEAPGAMGWPPEKGPGIVLTAIGDIPGAEDRGGPFLGAQMFGYVPAATKGRVGDGTMIVAIGIIKTQAYYERTVPTTVEKPFDPDAPQSQGQS